jgi:hypothetical protein
VPLPLSLGRDLAWPPWTWAALGLAPFAWAAFFPQVGGFLITTALTLPSDLGLTAVPGHLTGVASGVLTTAQRLGIAVGTAALAALFFAAITAAL